jgi:hypothetical protein
VALRPADRQHRGTCRLQAFWRDLKRQDQKTIERLKQLIREEIEKNCF